MASAAPPADLADADAAAAPRRKRRMLPMILIGLFLMLALGGGGFYAVYAGLILGDGSKTEEAAGPPPLGDIGFVSIQPVLITLPPPSRHRNLRITTQVEVVASARLDVETLMPRILDVINGYLRAIDPAWFEDPSALVRIRAQLLRRIQLVTGEGRVRDLLITEFILN